MMAMPAVAQTTIATNTDGTAGVATNFLAQSFTVSGAAPVYNNVNISFLNGVNNVAVGTLYLFTTEQTVTPNQLATDFTNRIGSATALNNVYSFGSTVYLSNNTQYFAYSASTAAISSSSDSAYSGGGSYGTPFGNLDANFAPQGAQFDDAFAVTASAAPEPASWGLMILGAGVAGSALRHRRRPASRSGGRATAV